MLQPARVPHPKNRGISHTEAAWQEREERFRLIQETSGVGFWDFDVKTEACSWSDETFILMGQDPARFTPTYKSFLACVHPDDRERVDAAVQTAIRRGTEYNVQFRIVRPDGTTHGIAARGRAIYQNGLPLRMLGAAVDITHRKLAVSGQLVAAAAHELKNPMEAMINALYLLQHNPSLDDAALKCLAILREELDRMQVVVSHTLGLYRESAAPEVVKLSEVLDAVVDFYAHKIRHKQIGIHKRYDFSGVIKAVPGEIRQVFTNLVVNALEAVPFGGKVIIHTSAGQNWDEATCKGVRVIVADNGPGIRPEHRQSICEPFFTTKGNKGSGLGLWVSKGFVEKHGGSIRVRSSVQPGKSGTVFAVFLPARTSEHGDVDR
jgi:PAS domain S-box-containing protein